MCYTEWLRYGHKFAQRFGHGAARAKSTDSQRSPVFIQWIDCVYQVCAMLH
jgi:hypothetical protein